ncbi:thioredoxin family protein [Traorella massiliensis]|uniref:thioredoxin family protein n=1 Tax=Traorella massiliensis TaxID=1903263 RepID=UPI0008F7F336|nr:thioredoxin family protein [Traorella massiliensis]
MLNNENFKEVLGQSRFAVTLISGEGCANCVSMLPMVLKLKERNDMDVYIVEVSPSNYEINEHYDIKVVPTILLTSYGEAISKITGYQPEEIFELYIEAKLEETGKRAS